MVTDCFLCMYKAARAQSNTVSIAVCIVFCSGLLLLTPASHADEHLKTAAQHDQIVARYQCSLPA